MNVSLRVESDAVVASDKDNAWSEVRVFVVVVGELDLGSVSGGVDDEVVVEVEEKRGVDLVVYFPSSIRFVVRNELAAILSDEIASLCLF